jgi:glutathione S-transferase
MTLKLWGRSSSGNVQKALWALDELGLPYEAIEAGGAHGIVGDAAYRAINPNGLVPTLEEDGFVLWESNAILRYLAQHHGGPLALPEAPRARALIDQWLDWQATAFTPAMRDAFLQLVRVAPEKRDPGVIEASRANSERCAALLDRHLADTSYVAGERFSIADIAVGLAAHRWFQLPLEREERPNIHRWLGVLAQRPASSAVLSLPLT